MKRMHIHVGVESLDKGIKFYSALFGAEPARTEVDYAKWMLEDPRINFAISMRADKIGIDHLGLQVDDAAELEELRERLKSADMSIFDEGETVCCYACSDKSWVRDPSSVAWEAYRSMDDVQLFSGSEPAEEKTCCTPETRGQPNCCEPLEKASAETNQACCA